jgi:hypothetical protein
VAELLDCVIGGFSGYGWDKVRVWARSLGASGFAGRKVALVRRPGAGVVSALVAEGFEVVDFSHIPDDRAPYVERFGQMHRYLYHRREQGVRFRWVVTTDVRDVCFQSNPIEFLERLGAPRLVLSHEGLPYAHAPWNAANMASAFGDEALGILRRGAPFNAGVLAGGHEAITGLAFLIDKLASAATERIADQAALNLLVEGLAGALFVHRVGSAEPWACQAGVVADPRRIERNRPHLLGPEPSFRDGLVVTADGEPYAIVHQYDLVPEWATAIQARYGQ